MNDSAQDDDVLPETRDLTEVIAACDRVIKEVHFQAYRLRDLIVPQTEEETRHFTEMREDYERAERTLKRLLRYHKKRLRRLEERGTLEMKSFDEANAIDPSGRAKAVVDDSESPV